MDRNIAICYFSGTGNTAYVVDLALNAFTRSGASVDLFKIEDMCRKKGAEFVPADYDMLGIAHPVLGFDCPGFIYEFVHSLPPVENKLVFLLKTAGDYHAVNRSASHSIKKILTKKGYDPFYDDIIAMPVNWLIAYDDQLNRQLVEAASSRVEAAIERVLAHERKILSNVLPLRLILKAIGYLEDRHGAKYFGRYLMTSASCDLCGECVRDCPVGNIDLKNDKIVFDGACTWCMRCIYNCPQHAIGNKYMNLFILRGGYSLTHIRALKFEPIDFTNPKLPFWHRYFRRYFNERRRIW